MHRAERQLSKQKKELKPRGSGLNQNLSPYLASCKDGHFHNSWSKVRRQDWPAENLRMRSIFLGSFFFSLSIPLNYLQSCQCVLCIWLPLARTQRRRNSAVPVVSVYDNLGGHSASFAKYWLKLYFLCLLMKCVMWEKIRGDPEVEMHCVYCFSAVYSVPRSVRKDY